MHFQAYHGVSASQHQANVTSLSARGYGMISLSVYGDPGSPEYAAVWVDRPMPSWVAVHGIGPAAYQAWFDTWAAKGYASALVSATGSGDLAIFAAVMSEGVTGRWLARHGLSQADFTAQNSAAQAQGLMPHCIAIYGDAGSRTYAGVWRANPGFVKWMVNPADPAGEYQTTFNTDTQLPGYVLNGWRPGYVTLSTDQTYCSLFTDDYVGPWEARHGMSAAEYQTEFDNQNRAGRYPICVQGGGIGSGTRYAAIFASQDIPSQRAWTVIGEAVPAYTAIDDAMKAFMQANAVRAAQVAFGRNGTIEFARAYTWAEPGYRVTQPADRFLLASCSKMFCAAAVQSLFDANTLTSDSLAYGALGISDHTGKNEADKITIQQLLDHKSGYDDTVSPFFDPTYNMGQIALSQGVSPLTKLDIAQYMYAQKLQHTPGDVYAYSNYGYLLLAAIVEKVTGQDYFAYVQATLLDPASIAEVGVLSTTATGRTNQEAIAEDPGLGQNALDPGSPLQVPAVYGGDGEINELGVGNDGLGASARAMAQFAHLHAVWGNGPRSPGLTRAGGTPGASTYVWSRTDGVDAAFTLNTRTWPPGTPDKPVDNLQTKLDALLP